MRVTRKRCKDLVGKLENESHMEDPGVHQSIILK